MLGCGVCVVCVWIARMEKKSNYNFLAILSFTPFHSLSPNLHSICVSLSISPFFLHRNSYSFMKCHMNLQIANIQTNIHLSMLRFDYKISCSLKFDQSNDRNFQYFCCVSLVVLTNILYIYSILTHTRTGHGV